MSDSEHSDHEENPTVDELDPAEVQRIAERNARTQRRQAARRGRPPAVVATRTRELRLTPPDGLPVTDWEVDSQITKLLACEEGGEGTGKALHYHAVIETTYTDDALRGWIRRILRLTPFTNMGNRVYRTGEPHEATYQYTVKCKNVVCRHGHTDAEIAGWMEASDQYNRDVEAQRRRLQRLRSQSRDKQLRTVEELTLAHARDNRWAYTSPDGFVRRVLHECTNANIEFPTRTQMEAIVNRIRWKLAHELPEHHQHHADAVVQYYARGLQLFSRE